MKKNIHASHYGTVTVRCRCGREPFTVQSTMKQPVLNAENCLKCLPMNTGVYKTRQEGDSARARLFKNLSLADLEKTNA